MNCECVIILLCNLIVIINGKLSLKIFKDINGLQMPINDTEIEESAGLNLTLTCKLVDDVLVQGFTIHLDNKLSWGLRKDSVQFETVKDLEELATSTSILQQFLNKTTNNEVQLQFLPLTSFDYGLYFCMSLKYKLFKIIDLRIKNGDENVYNFLKKQHKKRLNSDTDNIDVLQATHFNNNPSKPFKLSPIQCMLNNINTFACKSDLSCVNIHHICDGIKDCDDGSDEDVQLCGVDPCAGKRKCKNQRCISEAMCCSKLLDSRCNVTVKPSCCYEYFPFNHDSELDWPQLFDNQPGNSDSNAGVVLPPYTKPNKPHSDEDSLDNFPFDFEWPPKPTPNKPHSSEFDNYPFKLPEFEWPPNPTPNKPHSHQPEFGGNYPFKPEFEWVPPPKKPHLLDPDFGGSSNVEVHHTWKTESKLKTTNTVLIVVPCIIALIIIVVLSIILIVLRKSARTNQNRWRRTGDIPPFVPVTNNTPSVTVSTSANSNIVPDAHNTAYNNRNANVSQPNTPNADLPPSYDEAVTNVMPSAPPLYKID